LEVKKEILIVWKDREKQEKEEKETTFISFPIYCGNTQSETGKKKKTNETTI